MKGAFLFLRVEIKAWELAVKNVWAMYDVKIIIGLTLIRKGAT
ncbi:hypothetical protein SLEP1_g41040 [Rubroshorea leprosula]|uniref:Uncharacterized protein n=1 Tax=Rubroshorea leprosula TaxID=152421 RepID=A0AAV5L5P5_9ROSI|nr:hypothetical protein SLEP1_g41040 [Rubroshorea leprosula]